eukprot:11188227-Lingulodinium_polyedra.AAC.1
MVPWEHHELLAEGKGCQRPLPASHWGRLLQESSGAGRPRQLVAPQEPILHIELLGLVATPVEARGLCVQRDRCPCLGREWCSVGAVVCQHRQMASFLKQFQCSRAKEGFA